MFKAELPSKQLPQAMERDEQVLNMSSLIPTAPQGVFHSSSSKVAVSCH